MTTIGLTVGALIVWGAVLKVIHVSRRDKKEWDTRDYRRW